MNSEELQLLPVETAHTEPVSIAYRFQKPKDGKPTYLWFGGFKSDMDSTKAEALAAWARENGAGCLRFDYSGHGRSGGRFEDGTIGAWLAEAAAMYEHVLINGPAVFVGSSMGGWIALLLAQRLAGIGAAAPKGIVLIAPAWNMTRLIWESASEEARAAILSQGVYMRPSAYGEPYAITKALIGEGESHIIGDGSLPARHPDPRFAWVRRPGRSL